MLKCVCVNEFVCVCVYIGVYILYTYMSACMNIMCVFVYVCACLCFLCGFYVLFCAYVWETDRLIKQIDKQTFHHTTLYPTDTETENTQRKYHARVMKLYLPINYEDPSESTMVEGGKLRIEGLQNRDWWQWWFICGNGDRRDAWSCDQYRQPDRRTY